MTHPDEDNSTDDRPPDDDEAAEDSRDETQQSEQADDSASPDDDSAGDEPETADDEAAEDSRAEVDDPPDLLTALTSDDPAERLAAVSALGEQQRVTRQLLRALEQVAASDADDDVREAAFDALQSAAMRLAQRQSATRLTLFTSRWVLAEIARWQTDDFITPIQARLLAQRYDVFAEPKPRPPIPKPEPKPEPKPKAPPRSLSEILLSEAAVQIALYMGAFFVVAASCFMFFALTDVFQSPIPGLLILGLLVVSFFGASLLTIRKLRQASFVFFIVGTLIIPAGVGTLLEILGVRAADSHPYWMLTALVLGLVWVGGMLLYKSRLFSVLALFAFTWAPVSFTLWIDQFGHLTLFLISVVNLGALAAAWWLRRWQQGSEQEGQLFWPLSIVAHLQQATWLSISAIMVLGGLAFGDSPARWLWLAIAATWGIATLFYLGSQWVEPFVLFVPLAVATLMPVPLLALGIFDPDTHVVLGAAWVWGLVLAAASEVIPRFKWDVAKAYGPWLLAGGGLLFTLAAFGEWLNDWPGLGATYFAGAAVVYFALNFVRHRAERHHWVVWTAALLAGIFAWFALFSVEFIVDLNVFSGLIFSVPAWGLLALNLGIHLGFKIAGDSWQLPPLVLGLLTLGLGLLVTLVAGIDSPGWAAVTLGIHAVLLMLFAVLDARPWERDAEVINPTSWHYRWVVWTAALAAGALAWVMLFNSEPVANLNVFLGLIYSVPVWGLLALNLGIRLGFKTAGDSWQLPPLALGLLALGAGLLITLITGVDSPGWAAAVLTVYAAFFTLFAILDSRPWVGYAATASLVLVVPYALNAIEWVDAWVLPQALLVGLYFGAGQALSFGERFKPWSEMLRISALGLGLLIALSAPLQDGPSALIGVVLVATYYAIEAFRRRNIWLGFPANLLYLGAYFMVLLELDVDQPQLFSMVAALMGLVMHYLLVRSKNSVAAVVTGTLSQLILLSTTYIQMIFVGGFVFFFLLFVQGLVVLAYGVVIRSRSLVIVPIGFVVLGVLTQVLIQLIQTDNTLVILFLVGCTGLLLLLLGVVALVLRERLLSGVTQLSKRVGDWRA